MCTKFGLLYFMHTVLVILFLFSVNNDTFSGILEEESESLFAYNGFGQSFEGFRDRDFLPAFEAVFDDPALEQRADEICGQDEFCRFDIAATRDENIGMATMQGVMEFDEVVELAQPSMCLAVIMSLYPFTNRQFRKLQNTLG